MSVLRSIVQFFAGALSILAISTTAFASAIPASTPLHFRGEAPMPAGYLVLCQATPRICNFEKSGKRRAHKAAVMRLNEARFRQLESVTQSVNRSMRSVEDRVRFGVSDRWTVGGPAGDCEDFALTKRALLIARGWPAEAVLVALVNARGRSHAVLVARTDAGDYVLDNLTSAVKPWRDTPYTWQEIQAPDAFAWLAL